jgi:2-polyprenyl-6-methoxyphenol hydroxylase-like FAD-dependent oxidoreductase
MASIQADFVVAADGQNSSARRAWSLQQATHESFRYAFRRHYRIAPWSPYMELHWSPRCQVYVTPVAADETCVVSMTRTPRLRLDDALVHFPRLQERLTNAKSTSREMGTLTVTRRLRRVATHEFALVGDASGSVDAITGEGLCLSFKQSLSLAEALKSGRIESYQRWHRSLSRRTQLMASLMLTLDRNAAFQRRALAGLAIHPRIFASLLAVHVGSQNFSNLFSWQLLNFCRTFLEA